MSPAPESRREALRRDAFHPNLSGDFWDVYLDFAYVHDMASHGPGAIKEAFYCVNQILRAPTHLFRGFLKEKDHSRRGEGWLCYCGVPSNSYDDDGNPREPLAKNVFLVFVTRENVVYNWRWERADKNNPLLPEDLEGRFKEHLR